MAKRKLGIIGWILSLLILLVLVNVGITAWTTFDLIAFIFRADLVIKIAYTVVAILGLIGLINLITKAIGKVA